MELNKAQNSCRVYVTFGRIVNKIRRIDSYIHTVDIDINPAYLVHIPHAYRHSGVTRNGMYQVY